MLSRETENFLDNLKAGLKKIWANLDYVPDCSDCGGTGKPIGNLSDTVYWKGRLTEVCFRCKGKGKV